VGLFRKAALVIALAGFAAISATVAVAGSERSSGRLDLRAELRLTSDLGGCPAPSGVSECAARTGAGQVSGLGAVTESYDFLVGLGPPSCPPDLGQALETTVRFVVAGKGEIHFALAAGGCIAQVAIYNQIQAYTITGGSGLYAGASGSGTVERRLGEPTATGRHGPETWTGTLDVPGLEYDTAPPTFSGATSKTVRAAKGARTARVRFTVTAQDDRDGAVPAGCTPRSGSRFRIGRTRVTCEATDGSANTAAASFTVTVRARK
jgi:hypothetical protein